MRRQRTIRPGTDGWNASSRAPTERLEEPPPTDFDDLPATVSLRRRRIAVGTEPVVSVRAKTAPFYGGAPTPSVGLRKPTRGEKTVVDLKKLPVPTPPAPRRRPTK
jgi:hypothetical protein